MKREWILKEIVEYYGLADNTKIYTIIPGVIVGDYGYVGKVENGVINLGNNLEKGFTRKVCGFLMKHKKLSTELDVEGSFYIIDGKPLMRNSNIFQLANNQLYYVNKIFWEEEVQNYYLSKKDSKKALKLFKMSNRRHKGIIATNINWLFSIMDN